MRVALVSPESGRPYELQPYAPGKCSRPPTSPPTSKYKMPLPELLNLPQKPVSLASTDSQPSISTSILTRQRTKSPGPGRLTTSQAGSRHLSVINKSQNPILNRQPYSVTKKLPRDFSSSQTIQPRAFTESQLSADTDSVPYAAATPKNAHSSTTNDKLLCEDDSAAPSESEYIENTESTSLFDRISAMYKL